MKTKNLIKLGVVFISVLGITLSGCKKDEEVAVGDPDTTSLQQLSQDENEFQLACDDAVNDVNEIISGTSKSYKSISGLPCNATIDSGIVVGDTITYTITYNGLNCSGRRSRTGQISVKKNINTKWKDAGTSVIITFDNFKVTKVYTGKSVTINGTKTFQNVSGGLLKDLIIDSLTTSLVHKVSGAIQVTFDNNTTRTWNIARQKTFSGTPGEFILTIDGFGTADGYSNLVTWGINRHDDTFYTQITQSVIHKQVCEWDPTSGVKIHQIPDMSKKATVTFGFDDNNQPVSTSSNNCPTKFRLDWEKNGNSGTIYLKI